MKSFVGTKRLIRLALRRDRIVVPVTLLLVLLMVSGSAPALISTYPDEASQLSYIASSAPSVVGRLFQGTVQGVNIGSIMMAEVYLFTAVILAVMSIFIVTRHTRKNEEMGSGELIGSTVTGRNAPLTAAMTVAVGTNVVAGILIFVTLAPFKELDLAGSAYFALSLALVGIVFAGIAAITAQLSNFSRGANSMAASALGALFLIRGFGDSLGELAADGLSVTASTLTWLSPLGWGYQVLPYTQNRLMPVFLMLGLFILSIYVAYALSNRRDIGSSIFEDKPGPDRAGLHLLGSSGLARKLQRGGLIIWICAMAFAGVIVGVMGEEYRSLFEESDLFGELLEASGATGNFSAIIFATMFSFMAPMAAGYIVSALSKMQDEESSGRLEYLMGTALSRVKWLFSHVGFVFFGTISIMAAMGLAAIASYYSVADIADVSTSGIFLGTLVNVPAMMVFAGAIVLLFSLKGRLMRTIAWSFFAFCALIPQLGVIFKWPQWIINISPFMHTPAAPSDSVEIQPILILATIAVGLLALSSVIFRQRDLVLK